MASIVDRIHPDAIHPFHAAMLAGTVPLFLGALLSDYAYSMSYQIQWSNFASWLIVGALLFGVVALVCAVIDLVRADRRGARFIVYTLVLLATCVLGFVNALIHARDGWAIMPTALVLSVVVAALACAATWIGFSGLRSGRRAGGAG